jgi:hypothetical protein
LHSLEDIYILVENINAIVTPAPCGPCDPTGAGVAKTGQKTSYATGDDGDKKSGIAWPDPRFTNNGDGTVTDNLTGLIWLRDATRFLRRSWVEAVDDCNKLKDDGLELTDGSVAGDWRLPNIKELLSLVDYSERGACLPADHPFKDYFEPAYWSSTSLSGAGSQAWILAMSVGYVLPKEKDVGYYVWPVRNGN